MISVGNAFNLARENIRKIIMQSDYMWDMSKISNYLLRQKPNLGLNQRDKKDYVEKINIWISGIEEEERIKKEEEEIQRKIEEEMKAKELEKERIEKMKLEKERIAKEKLRIQLEREEIKKKKLLEQEIVVQKALEEEKIESIKTLEHFDNLLIQIEQKIVDLQKIETIDKKGLKQNKKVIKKLMKDRKKLLKLKKKEEKKKEKKKKGKK